MLELSPSGRGLLQEHGPRFPDVPGHANYFASLGSPRRLEVLRDVGRALVRAADPVLTDRLAGIPELERYACFAADGHWHKAAAHDPRHDGVKMAVGHFYGLNLRTHTLRGTAPATVNKHLGNLFEDLDTGNRGVIGSGGHVGGCGAELHSAWVASYTALEAGACRVRDPASTRPRMVSGPGA